MEPIPPQDEITLQDWLKDEKLRAALATKLRDPVIRTALSLWREMWRCRHGQRHPTIIAGSDLDKSAAALGFFREGGNAAIEDLFDLARPAPRMTPAVTSDPRHFGHYQLQPDQPQPPPANK